MHPQHNYSCREWMLPLAVPLFKVALYALYIIQSIKASMAPSFTLSTWSEFQFLVHWTFIKVQTKSIIWNSLFVFLKSLWHQLLFGWQCIHETWYFSREKNPSRQGEVWPVPTDARHWREPTTSDGGRPAVDVQS